MLELGLHNPLAAAIGRGGQSEWALALQLLAQLPAQALVLAGALLARERARAAAGQTPVLRISFVKTLELMRPLWLTLALGGDWLSARQKQQLTGRFLKFARRNVTPQRQRPRSCPRAVRQPVSGWPRLRRNQSWEGPLHFKLL